MQCGQDELSQMTSLSSVQTKGVRRQNLEQQFERKLAKEGVAPADRQKVRKRRTKGFVAVNRAKSYTSDITYPVSLALLRFLHCTKEMHLT